VNKLLWIDLEMTGLEIEKEVIIEAAAVVTDFEFNELDVYHAIIKQDQKYLDAMDDWNTKHHGASGLTAAVATGKSPNLVEEELISLVKKHFSPEERAVLAGNSIMQDRLFISRYFKKLNERLHYRMVDVTSWKIIFNDKFKLKYNKKNTHRALDDINESISELKFYLSHIDSQKKS
jgi:oligoribonuclease